ncbi:hypothetical protein V2G26_016500 [Clonostachys chloroleuca]
MRMACGWDGGHPAAEVPNATNITSPVPSVATLNSFTSHNCLQCLGSFLPGTGRLSKSPGQRVFLCYLPLPLPRSCPTRRGVLLVLRWSPLLNSLAQVAEI